MKRDYHIHTEYSYDSKLKAVDLINKAIQNNYEAVAITEHLDLLPWELSSFGCPSFRKYTQSVALLKDRYASSPLRIYCGVEVGDYQLVRDQARDFISLLEFDLILGAVHFLSDHTNVAVPLRRPLDAREITDYYRQNLALVTDCDIAALAHLGVYKRYYGSIPDESHCRSLLRDIFQTMIARGIALELNFSSLRKPYGRIIPEPGQLELYRDLGGKLFSIGSDSHHLDHFDCRYPDLPAWISDNIIDLPVSS